MERLTSEASRTLPLLTWQDSRNATSSPGSAAGPSPCASPDGATGGTSGPLPCLASLSARQAKAMGLLTSGTSGLRTSTSLRTESRRLSLRLGNRLHQKTASLGSTLYRLTWRERATPSGRLIPALRASVRRTSASACIGWPTPCQQDGPKGGPGQGADRLPGAVALSGWPTPAAHEPGGTPEQHLARKQACKDRGIQMGASAVTHLSLAAQFAGWPTPQAHIIEAKPRPPIIGNRKPSDPQIGLADVAVHLAGWPTPHGNSTTGQGAEGRDGGLNIQTAAHLAGWPTQRAADGEKNVRTEVGSLKETARKGCPQDLAQAAAICAPARLTAFGELLTGCSAGMDSGGQLNPAHSRWLMAYPAAFDACSPYSCDWLKWQGWMQSLSPEQRQTALCACTATETPSTSNRRQSS